MLKSGPIPPITEQDVVDTAFNRWPHAAEVHVQFHTHLVVNAHGSNSEGVCICAIEGTHVRKQFTGNSGIDLLMRVRKNQADSGFETDLDQGSILSASELLWIEQTPGQDANEDQDDH